MKKIIEEIKRRCPIEEVASQILTLKGNSKRLVGLCPFHKERHPSFYIYPNTQTYYCFGCGASGDVFDLIMNLKHFSFPEACDYLANRFEIVFSKERPKKKKRKKTYQKLLRDIRWTPADRLRYLKEDERFIFELLGAISRIYSKTTEIEDKETKKKATVFTPDTYSLQLWIDKEIEEWERYFKEKEREIRDEERALFDQ